jgi:hypothetical protein
VPRRLFHHGEVCPVAAAIVGNLKAFVIDPPRVGDDGAHVGRAAGCLRSGEKWQVNNTARWFMPIALQ